MKKTTLATIKSFIRREVKIGQLYIKKTDTFNGMVDCVMPVEGAQFKKVEALNLQNDGTMSKYTLGIPGAWFVGSSRDYFTDYADDGFIGYEIYNSCGQFILAMPRR